MNKLQEYLEQKRINLLPTMYVVKNTPYAITEPIPRQITKIVQMINGIKYLLAGDSYPFEVTIEDGQQSFQEDEYGSGIGNLWAWTYFSTLDLEIAKKYISDNSYKGK